MATDESRLSNRWAGLNREKLGNLGNVINRPPLPWASYRRFMTTAAFDEVTKTEPEKSLLEPLTKKGGRNNRGRITTRHQGGGHKRRYRVIDFKRNKHGIPARVASIEYDPNRSARIALLAYALPSFGAALSAQTGPPPPRESIPTCGIGVNHLSSPGAAADIVRIWFVPSRKRVEYGAAAAIASRRPSGDHVGPPGCGS